MRRDQYPERACFNGSGLPIPSHGERWLSLIKVLIRFSIFLSDFCQLKELKLSDLALELANRTHCDPKTLTRAARDYLDMEPAFALGCAMAALRWLSEGWALI